MKRPLSPTLRRAAIIAGFVLVVILSMLFTCGVTRPTHVPTTHPVVTTTSTTSTVPVTTTTLKPKPAWHPPVTHPVIGSSRILALWTQTAVCEEGGWDGYSGYAYPDSLGINRHNWFYFGGTSDVSPWAQIKVAQRVEAYLGRPNRIADHSWTDNNVQQCGTGY